MELDLHPDPPATSPPPPRREPSRKPKPKRRFWRHLWRWAWLYVLVLGAASGVTVAAMIHMPEVDSLATYTPGLITSLYADDGSLLTTYAVENRVLLREDEIPDLLAKAVVAVEDANFYGHSGIDLKGVLRAAVENIQAGEITQGASTLTMQLAENLFNTRGRDWKRKIAEALLAVEIEKRYSKPQILSLYCNIVYMGEGVYGMEAAAQHFFAKSASELDLAETAVLAGMPQRPNAFNPKRNPELVIERRNHVLGRMLDRGYIDAEQHRQATTAPLLTATKRRERTGIGAYFAEDVRRYLEQQYGSKKLYDAGLQVATTLDPRVQEATEAAVRHQLALLDKGKGWRGPHLHLDAEDLGTQQLPSWEADGEPALDQWFEGIVLEAERQRASVKVADLTLELGVEGIEWTRQTRIDRILKRGDVAWFRREPVGEPVEGEAPELRLVLEQEPEIEAAAVVLESATGAVRALVGGWDFDRSKFNRATQARRQVGSAFKPFVFGAALESGFTAADTLFDAPTAFRGADNEPSYFPRNYHRRYWGIITLRRALELSVNITSVKLLDLVGVETVIDFARRCGLTSELPPYPSLALGSADIVPLELASAYSTFANQGLHVDPYLIEKVTTRDGRLLEEHLPQAQVALTPEIAYLVTHMLEGVVDRGTGASVSRLDLDLGGKTGTTNEYSDAWFVGFSPRHTLLVWVGYDQKKSLGNRMTGARAALPIWRSVVENGLEGGWIESGSRFTAPAGVSLVDIEHQTGLLPPPGYPGAVRVIKEAFLPGTEPTLTFEPEMVRIAALPWYQQRVFYLPKEGERMPEDVEDWTEFRLSRLEDSGDH